jgi:hypothetical protein
LLSENGKAMGCTVLSSTHGRGNFVRTVVQIQPLFNKHTGIKRPGQECGHSSPDTVQVTSTAQYNVSCCGQRAAVQPVNAAQHLASQNVLVHAQSATPTCNGALPLPIRHNLSPTISTIQKFNSVYWFRSSNISKWLQEITAWQHQTCINISKHNQNFHLRLFIVIKRTVSHHGRSYMLLIVQAYSNLTSYTVFLGNSRALKVSGLPAASLSMPARVVTRLLWTRVVRTKQRRAVVAKITPGDLPCFP